MNRQPRRFLPTLNRADFAPKVGSDFFPGVQAAVERGPGGAGERGAGLVTHAGNPVTGWLQL
jgi:hypothetical protein